MTQQNAIVSRLLRLGLAFSFLYAAISGFIAPDAWIGFLPQWIDAILPARLLLQIFGIYELLLAATLVIGIRRFETAILSFLTLVAITATNSGAFLITFRDVSLALTAAALAALEYRHGKTPAH